MHIDMFFLYGVALLLGARCAVLADNRGKKALLYALCSDSALMVTPHKHILKCSTLMRSTEPANASPQPPFQCYYFIRPLFL